jgi:hypothetical protein
MERVEQYQNSEPAVEQKEMHEKTSHEKLFEAVLDRALEGSTLDEVLDLPITPEQLMLPETLSEAAQQNATLLHMLSGHRGSKLRRLLQADNPTTAHLRKLYEWSNQVARGETADTSALETPAPPLLIDQPEDQVYQRIAFIAKYPNTTAEDYAKALETTAAQAVDHKSKDTKWIRMLPKVFSENSKEHTIERLLTEVGFIPKEFTQSETFKNDPADRITKTIITLVKLEAKHRSNPELLFTIRTERARLLNVLLQSPVKIQELQTTKRGMTFELDSNGLLINSSGLDSHIPYGLIEPETHESLERYSAATREILSPHARTEARLRTAAQNNEAKDYQELAKKQMDEYAKAVGWSLDGATALATIPGGFMSNEVFRSTFQAGGKKVDDSIQN